MNRTAEIAAAATDPARPNLFMIAALFPGAGASAGGDEIVDGGTAGDSDWGGGDGGDVVMPVGAGTGAVGVLVGEGADAGGLTEGEGVGEADFGETALDGD